MFKFVYDYCDHVSYLQLLASRMGVQLEDNVLWLPPAVGNGYVKVETLTNGLQVLINECTIGQEWFIHRKKGDGNGFTLRFDELHHLQSLSVKIGDAVLEHNTDIYSGAFLTNNFSELQYTINKGIQDRCVNIYFTTNWFNNYSGVQSNPLWMHALANPGSAIHFEVLTIEYRELMEEIFALKKTHPVFPTVLQNRVMLMLEKFFRGLYQKMSSSYPGYGMPEDELKRMILIESILVRDLASPPPPITELARIAMMSITKLKSSFKRIYGYGLYEYYQKNRMLKAKQLLTAGSMSVKEVGLQLGFRNLSNFTLAFKKEFNILPSQL